MKFLCLPGAYSNAEGFKAQLGPFAQEVERQGIATFAWTQGLNEVYPPETFVNNFGVGKLYKFIETDTMFDRDDPQTLRDFPADAGTAEDTLRQLVTVRDRYPLVSESVTRAVDQLLREIDEDPDIAGILGYSEGAMTAATVLLEEGKRAKREGKERRLKCAIFMGGWPPFSRKDEKSGYDIILCDETDEVIDVPTLHVIGCHDPYMLASKALFNICDEETSEMFDHGKGHSVPRDMRSVKDLCGPLRRLVGRAN
ncbi:serine hydrolase FSH [Cladorrhinum sp. PSN259]|nr:serine hydrolase FSH [Cladorrhinum sp. PSN259]